MDFPDYDYWKTTDFEAERAAAQEKALEAIEDKLADCEIDVEGLGMEIDRFFGEYIPEGTSTIIANIEDSLSSLRELLELSY